MNILFKRVQHFSKPNAINSFAYTEKRMNLIKISATLSTSWVLSRNLLEDNMKDLCSVHVIPSADTFLHILYHTEADNK